MTDIRFDDKVAIVTGAGGGLGRAHALLMARRGARVVVNDLPARSGDSPGADPSRAEAVVAEIEDLGGKAVADHSSVATREGANTLVGRAIEHFGRVDILVNNAGILRDKTFHKMATEDLEPVIDVHLMGGIYVAQAVWGRMREQGYGRIINTTSAAGLFGNFGQANYAAAKMGLVGLTRVLANEGRRHNINVNAIAPIAFTDMTANLMGKFEEQLRPERVSPLVAWLVHEDCDTTGEVYSVGGGYAARVMIALTHGHFLGSGISPESVRDDFDSIGAETGYYLPRNPNEELRRILPRL